MEGIEFTESETGNPELLRRYQEKRRQRRRGEVRRMFALATVVALAVIAAGGAYLSSRYQLVLDDGNRSMALRSVETFKPVAARASSTTERAVIAETTALSSHSQLPQAARTSHGTSAVTMSSPLAPVARPAPPPAATPREDPEGYVTSFFGIVVRNKDFQERKR